ncbi:MAG: hypothetical protein E6833_14040, partial [Bradyrhizobium sp.]|nr:hypothetical protein [Bradyrhizobium sp.]
GPLNPTRSGRRLQTAEQTQTVFGTPALWSIRFATRLEQYQEDAAGLLCAVWGLMRITAPNGQRTRPKHR